MNTTPTPTFGDLAVPLTAVRLLLADFPHLPAVDIRVSTIYPQRLELALHDNLAAFEAWREALGIAPDAVACAELPSVVQLEVLTVFAGATVRLCGYAPPVQRSSGAAGTDGTGLYPWEVAV
ncbi:hypothetical protein [Streptomyces sp. NPDC093109]|uniref:hypothetical protein n=1 Tax=Streptomyces sp. NPDC093109 TaxID=3154977 RepID=UPI00345079B7